MAVLKRSHVVVFLALLVAVAVGYVIAHDAARRSGRARV